MRFSEMKAKARRALLLRSWHEEIFSNCGRCLECRKDFGSFSVYRSMSMHDKYCTLRQTLALLSKAKEK